MNDLFEVNEIEKIIEKITNNINNLFGFPIEKLEITDEEVSKLIFVIRAELLINNSRDKRDFDSYTKANKLFNYLIELKLLDNIFDNLNKEIFEIFIRLKNFSFLRNEKFNEYENILKINYSNYLMDDVWMSPEQIYFYNIIKEKNNVLLSLPTSFGKTFLTQKAVLEKLKLSKNINILIILPTNALINEYLIFFKEKKLPNVKIITEIYHTISNNSNIFLLTQEKVLSIFSKNINNSLIIHWLIVDEFYNIDLSTTRSQILYVVINLIFDKNNTLKSTFLLPGIKNAKEKILKYINFDLMKKTESFDTIFSLSSRDIFYIKNAKETFIKKNNIVDQEMNIFYSKKEEIFNNSIDGLYKISKSVLKNDNNANFLIYSPKSQIFNNADNLYYKIEKTDINSDIKDLYQYLLEFYGEQYKIIKYLEKGIGIHKNETDSFTRDVIEQEFKNKNIKFLFCTPTLLQGVNLNTKYLFILTNWFPSDYFKEIDARNLIGRIGRVDTNPHGFGFYIYNKKSSYLENAILNKSGIENSIIDKKFLEENNKIVDKKIKKIDIFIEKINNDNNINFKTEYLENNKKTSLIDTNLQDYFLDLKVDSDLNDRIKKLKTLLRECFKFMFLNNYKNNIKEFKDWILEINKKDFLKTKIIINENQQINHWFIIEKTSLFLNLSISYIFETNRTDDYIFFQSLIFSKYLKSYSIKEMVKETAEYYKNYNSEKNNMMKYYFNGTDKIMRYDQRVVDKKLEIFNINNDLHITILLDEIMSFIKTEIEFELMGYINNLTNKIFSDQELIEFQKQIDMLTINEKTIFLLENGFKRNIAVSLSTKKYDKCFYKEDNKFNDINNVINNLLIKLKSEDKKQLFLIKILEKEVDQFEQ